MNRLSLLIIWTLLGLTLGSAQSQRPALVTQSSGQALLEPNQTPLKALQYLSSGDTVSLAEGSSVHLTFVYLGTKERVQGPCRIQIGPQGCTNLSKTGKITVQASPEIRTLVPESENLKKLGSSLQANADTSKEAMLAFMSMADKGGDLKAGGGSETAIQSEQNTHKAGRSGSVVATGTPMTQVAVGRTRSSQAKAINLPPAILYPAKLGGVLHWHRSSAASPGLPYKVQFWERSTLVYEGQVSSPHLPLSKGALKPGNTYRLLVQPLDQSQTLVDTSFTVLSEKERKSIETATKAWRDGAAKGNREASHHLFTYYENRGLLLEALEVISEAHRVHPEDPGVLLALARTQLNLGRFQGARDNLEKLDALPTKSL